MARFAEVEETPYGLTVVHEVLPRKMITAGRFSKVIGCNRWATDFQAWCEIMRCKVPPFEDNKYTVAGKAIEPKLIEYARECVSPYIRDPEQYFECDDAKREMDYEFFDDDLFGGMWDALAFDRPGVVASDLVQPIAVIECKTTSRPQDWEFGVPDNYKAQGLLYAELLDVDDVYFPVAFLKPDDYDRPEEFECTEDNTRVYHITRDEPIGSYSSVKAAMDYAVVWHDAHVVGNRAPQHDEKKDAEYLALIRQAKVSDLPIDIASENELDYYIEKLDELDTEIAAIKESCSITELEKQRKSINAKVQALVKPVLSELKGKESLSAGKYVFKISKTRQVDYRKLEEDGLLEKYVTYNEQIRTNRI